MGFLKVKTTTRADRISNFQMTTCDFGTPVPDICGTVKISPNVINWKDFYSQEIKTTQKSGKSKTTSYSYKYYVYLELALGEGVDGLGACWVGDTKYASLNAANNTKDAQGFPLTFNSTGNKSSYMSSKYPSLAINYDGLAYLHSPGGGTSGSYLGENSASVPSYAFEVKGQLRGTGDGTDVNPADYILHILKKIGLWSGSGNEEDIVKGINNFRNYCKAQNLLISSPAESSQRKGQDVIKDLCDLFDIYFFWSNNSFKIAIKDHTSAGSWKPNKTVIYDLTPDDMLEQTDGAIVSFSRKDSSEIYNRFTVEFNNRANDYETETISLELPESIKNTGLRQQSTISAPYIYTKNRAIKLAQIASRKNQRERNKYSIRLDWAYAVLEPGDLVTLTDPVIGLDKQIAMVDTVTENKDGTINVELLQYVDGDYEDAIIDIEDDVYNVFDYNTEPSSTAAPIFFQPPPLATQTGNELWVAIKGSDDNWGGCDIMIANQPSNFQYLGSFKRKASYGKLTKAIEKTETELTAEINGEFENATQADAENANSMFWVNGECLSYQTATKNEDGTWTFGGLIRGQYNSEAKNHYKNTDIVFCDGSIWVMELTQSYFGRTLYFKFPAFNIFGGNAQDESEAETYSYTIAVPQFATAESIVAYATVVEIDDVNVLALKVDFLPPNVNTYIHSAIYYKSENDEDWHFAGYAHNTMTIPNITGGMTYYVSVCPQDSIGGISYPNQDNTVEVYIEATDTKPPQIPNPRTTLTEEGLLVEWDAIQTMPIKYYKLKYFDYMISKTEKREFKTTGTSHLIYGINTYQFDIELSAVSMGEEESDITTLDVSYVPGVKPVPEIIIPDVEHPEEIEITIPNWPPNAMSLEVNIRAPFTYQKNMTIRRPDMKIPVTLESAGTYQLSYHYLNPLKLIDLYEYMNVYVLDGMILGTNIKDYSIPKIKLEESLVKSIDYNFKSISHQDTRITNLELEFESHVRSWRSYSSFIDNELEALKEYVYSIHPKTEE